MSDWKRSGQDQGAGAGHGGAPRVTEHGSPVVQGSLDAAPYRVAIVAAVFNDEIVSGLLEGAVAAWAAQGGAPQNLLVVRVPGAFELPVAARQLAKSGRHHAIVALGCVIRGDTPHFDYVAGECASGLQRVSCDTGVPVAFGVLTVENDEQARERAQVDRANKGGEAMRVAIEMADLLVKLG